ncbi:hypothetical protein DMC30DRAFT_414474 [Rhodotorula diobovata]|uniref:Uncharacterized protein n=1 Tax=Rhodotorula diobovata TaxID=5288 RepID=A0A5C5G3U9_9BASI|nr:hypothetical protein DMC30DRAFT_414474 [Rhodotorula diobovata]
MATEAPPLHPALAKLLPPPHSPAVHPIRVASHSSLRLLVSFSLSHLSSPSAPPLCLHTLPASPSPSPSPSSSSSVDALPKLVSLAQLITRTSPLPLHSYTALDSLQRLAIQQGGSPTGDDHADDAEHMRRELVALEWLEGRAGSKRRPRRRHTPCMVILLSPVPLPSLPPSSFTHQPPARPPKPKPKPKTKTKTQRAKRPARDPPEGEGDGPPLGQ